MNKSQEYAAVYTSDEKRKLLINYALIVFGVLLLGVFIVIPALEYWISRAHCLELFGMQGLLFLAYMKYLIFPAVISAIMAFVLARDSVKIYRAQQMPLPGARVFRKTKIIRGKAARTRAVLMALLVPLAFFMYLPWSLYAIEKDIQNINVYTKDYALCVSLYNAPKGL